MSHSDRAPELPPGSLYRIDLERWWAVLQQHLTHPSTDVAVLHLAPNRELLLRSGWGWAGVKSVLDQIMAVTTTQLLQELPPDTPPPAGRE
ncbi:MAG: hypothetical protein M3Q65_00900 [Chloroflexota bacterium]|nr:hypothetical protein [Chloroflexota bacterium]